MSSLVIGFFSTQEGLFFTEDIFFLACRILRFLRS